MMSYGAADGAVDYEKRLRGVFWLLFLNTYITEVL